MQDMQEQKLFSVSSLNQYILCLGILLLIGCATMKEYQKVDALENATNNYRDAIIWGDYNIAAKFRKVQDSQRLSWDFSEFKKFRVTSYEILNRAVSDNTLQAHQTIEIKYYNIQSMIEKTLVDEQLWEYDEEEKVWYLQGDLPQFQ